ncbi:MAG TPA: hypothetical protein VN605_03220 [Thermoanaerobaculia bacterium]|nr:hypothetical protein [Thermoanaerobaculia bacterium]
MMHTHSERPPRLARFARSPLAWIAVLVTLGPALSCAKPHATRGIGLVDPTIAIAPGQTAGLFVGVQRFTSTPPPSDVEYAVDDAVDLATIFAERIVDAKRIVIAIAGEPRKPSSKAALQKLRDDGANVVNATKENVEHFLEQQATAAGGRGELIVSFATHGFTDEGVPYVLAANSSFEDHDSAISAARVLDIAAGAGRSFIVLDACRERMSSVRGGSHRVDTRAPLLSAMRTVAGQVVFAPAAGKVTIDNDHDRNGVFSGAILGGLRGGATCDGGYVTVDALRDYVEERMMRWMRRHYPDAEPPAIQVNIDGESGKMPIGKCDAGPRIGRVDHTPSSIDVFDTAGTRLWGQKFEDAVIATKNVQPENIVVVATAHRISAFDAQQNELWSRDMSHEMFIDTLIVQKLLHGNPANQILVLATGDRASRIAMWAADGAPGGTYEHPERLIDVLPMRRTSNSGWKLVTASKNILLLFDPKNLERPIWRGDIHPAERTIRHLSTDDQNHDGNLDIVLTLASGHTLYVDLEGQRIASVADGDTRFERLAPQQHPASARRPVSARVPRTASARKSRTTKQ